MRTARQDGRLRAAATGARDDRGGRGGAFTLIEVMISVVIVLVLIYGVTQVFTLSSNAMGANQALSNIVRDHRAAIATFVEDFHNCAPDSPAFVIASEPAWWSKANSSGARAKFRNVNEEQQYPGDPADDPRPPNAGARFVRADDLNPRLDRVSFFTRNLYRRYVSDELPAKTSSEAYVWYGHTAYMDGGTMYIPENQYISERNLGRAQILMKHYSPTASGTPESVLGNEGYVGGYSAAALKNAATYGGPADLFPLGWIYKPYLLSDDANKPCGDIAPMSIEDFRQRVNGAYFFDSTSPKNWYLPLVDQPAANQYMRYVCDPREFHGGTTSDKSRLVNGMAVARTSRYFLGHVTQFIVEYAGDYLNQDANGDIVSVGGQAGVAQYVTGASMGDVKTGVTDGIVDYIVDKSAGATPDKWVRRTRWYGLPRDADGDGKIGFDDVVPLADIMQRGGIVQGHAPWEVELPVASKNYESILAKGKLTDYAAATGNVPFGFEGTFRYTCAWRNDAPQMIRVLLKIDDPSGKLQDGQWYEYVLTR